MSSFDYSDILKIRQHLHGSVSQSPFEQSVDPSKQTNSEQFKADFSGIPK